MPRRAHLGEEAVGLAEIVCPPGCKIALAIGSLGNVRTETVRAFTESEYRTWSPSCPEECRTG